MALTLLAGCDPRRDVPEPRTSAATPSASATPAATEGAARRLMAAEHRRASAEVTDDDRTSRDPALRRLAARALARIADTRSVKALRESLSDEDPAVVSWSAYGLGWGCKGNESEHVRALTVRGAALAAEGISAGTAGDGLAAALDDPWFALSDGLARCATREAERTLRAWLDLGGGRADAAALALGRLASTSQRLDDASLVALLDAAGGDAPIPSALLAFTRLPALAPGMQERLLEVATPLAATAGPVRPYAVRALGRAGDGAAAILVAVLGDATAPAPIRADAAHALARLGTPGQTALAEALTRTVGDAPTPDLVAGDRYGWLTAIIGGLATPHRAARQALEALSDLQGPDAGAASVRRRVVETRCAAAALLAGTASLHSRLARCDPDRGRPHALAVLRVLDRGPLTGTRHRRWLELVNSEDRVVRQTALDLMPSHPEIPEPHAVLAAALAAKDVGTVSAAATVLAAYPDRAVAEPRGDRRRQGAAAGDAGPAQDADPALVKALTEAVEAERAPDDVELRATLLDAAAALQVTALRPRIEALCASEWPTLRERAEKALKLLGVAGRRCDAFTPPERGPAELDHLVGRPVEIELATDGGAHSLTLDPSLAPVAVTRIVDLVRAGFYDGMVVHRVVPGFVAQLGDPGGDGYGGCGKPPLRCETSPATFAPLRVGVALAGRDTGSSQIFVTLGPFPHLDGNYALIGTASPSWTAVARGDVIQRARVVR